MRSILTRIGKNNVDSKLKDNDVLKLYEGKSTASLKPTEPELRTKPPAVFPAKISAGVGAQLGASKKPFFLGHADKGSTVFPGNSSEYEKNTSKDGSNAKPPYIPISVVTGGRDTTTVSPKLRAYILGGVPSATSAIPNEYADLANVMNKVGDVINFENWADLTAKQQLTVAQRAGLSEQDKQTLLNTSSHYVETIAKIQDVFENRYNLGITLADARNVAKELFDIANEREEATTRTGKYEQDAVFAPKALRWLDEKEKKILEDLIKNAGETDWDTEYTGGHPQHDTSDDGSGSTHDGNANGFIQVPGIPIIGPGRDNPPVNCYGYVLMNLGIQPSNGNYDIQPGMLSETRVGDHAHADGSDRALNTDTESIINYIIRDIEKTGRDIRMIESKEDAAEGETLVALKNDNFFFGGDQYHVAIQLPDGTWADKRGTGNESRQGEIDNPDGPWVAEWWKYVYDTETYYFAISEP